MEASSAWMCGTHLAHSTFGGLAEASTPCETGIHVSLAYQTQGFVMDGKTEWLRSCRRLLYRCVIWPAQCLLVAFSCMIWKFGDVEAVMAKEEEGLE